MTLVIKCFWYFIIFPSFVLWSSDILREFNPSVTGFSKGICNETSPDAYFNQAVPGAKSGSVFLITSSILNKTYLNPSKSFPRRDMPQQVRTLVDIMKSDAVSHREVTIETVSSVSF